MKEITRTRGSATSAAPASTPPGARDSTPGSRPASSKTRMTATPPLTAVRGSGLRTTALPSARAGATDRMASTSGTLNGAMTPTTPAGTRQARLSRGCAVGRTCPVAREASAAAS